MKQDITHWTSRQSSALRYFHRGDGQTLQFLLKLRTLLRSQKSFHALWAQKLLGGRFTDKRDGGPQQNVA